MKHIDLDEVLKLNGFGYVINAIKNEEDLFIDWKDETIIVNNLTVNVQEYSSTQLVEKGSNIGATNIAIAFGEMGYKFLPDDYITKYYNCNKISFGDHTERIVNLFSTKIEDIKNNNLKFNIDLSKIPYKKYIRSLEIDKKNIVSQLMEKYCSKSLVFEVAEKRNVSPKQAREYIESNIHSWAIVILSKYDAKALKKIESYYDFSSNKYIDVDLENTKKEYATNLMNDMRLHIKAHLKSFNIEFDFDNIVDDFYPLFKDNIENELKNYLAKVFTERYKSSIDVPNLDFSINEKAIINSGSVTKILYEDRAKITVFKAILTNI